MRSPRYSRRHLVRHRYYKTSPRTNLVGMSSEKRETARWTDLIIGLALAFLLGVMVSGCKRESGDESSSFIIKDSAYMRKYIDKKQDVVCYRAHGWEGIDCLRLEKDRR